MELFIPCSPRETDRKFCNKSCTCPQLQKRGEQMELFILCSPRGTDRTFSIQKKHLSPYCKKGGKRWNILFLTIFQGRQNRGQMGIIPKKKTCISITRWEPSISAGIPYLHSDSGSGAPLVDTYNHASCVDVWSKLSCWCKRFHKSGTGTSYCPTLLCYRGI